MRSAIVGGVRTPFAKAGTAFKNVAMRDLAQHTLKALLERTEVNPEQVSRFTYGSVLLDPRTPNLAREIWFGAKLPHSVYAHFVSNNCITGLVALTDIVSAISTKKVSIGIAGGVESMSKPALLFRGAAADAFHRLTWARTFSEKLSAVAALRPSSFLPEAPSPKEPSTGLTMGQHMEITAQKLSIPREEQDALALLSHQNAHQATEDGRLTAEIAPFNGLEKDNIIRSTTTLEKLARLKPVFDRSERGTLTAGNSSALTDGASAVLLMSEDKLKEEGREALAFVRDYEFGALSPEEGLLMAPTVAVPKLLRRNNLSFNDFDLIEVHEAFAAQVLANIAIWEKELGSLPREKLNVLGGSIAIGHPFAATGGRIVTTLSNELKRRGAKRGLISICAAGAMAGAMILERD